MKRLVFIFLNLVLIQTKAQTNGNNNTVNDSIQWTKILSDSLLNKTKLSLINADQFDRENQKFYSVWASNSSNGLIQVLDLKNKSYSTISATSWPGEIYESVYDPVRKRLLAKRVGRDNTYFLDSNNSWTKYGTGSYDSESYGQASFFNGASNRFAMMGGYGWFATKNWIFEQTGSGWNSIYSNNNNCNFPKRVGRVATTKDRKKIFIYSGQGNCDGNQFAKSCSLGSPWATDVGIYCWIKDLQEFDLTNNTLTTILSPNHPSIDKHGEIVYDYDADVFYQVGGYIPAANYSSNTGNDSSYYVTIKRFRRGIDTGFLPFKVYGNAPPIVKLNNYSGIAFYDEKDKRIVWVRKDGVWAFNTKIDSTNSNTNNSNQNPNCKPANHKKLSSSDSLTACTSMKLTSKNKKYVSYKWSTGDTTLSSKIVQSGLVTLTETDSLGCKNIDSVFVRLLKDELPKATDTVFYNLSLGDTLKLNVNSWFNNSKFNYYNYQKIAISEIQLIHKGADSLSWQGYAALKSNSTLKCLIEAKVFPKVLPLYLPKDSLVAWWPFNGNATDESGKNFKLNNAYVKFGKDSIKGDVAIFNGNAWLESDTSIFQNQTPITISFWAKTRHGYGVDIVGQSCGNDCNDDIRVQLNAPQCGYEGLSFKSPAHFATAPGKVSDSNWHHYALVLGSNNNYSYSNFKFYIDGFLVAIGPKQCGHNWGGWTYKPNAKYPLSIGKVGPLGNYFKGELDDIAIWKRALDSSEIKNIYFENCKPANHKKLTTSDSLTACTSLKLTSKNKKYSSYKWSTGDTTVSITIKKSGLVNLRETDSKGCVNIDTVYVRIIKDEISTAPDTNLCDVMSNDTLKLNLSNWFNNSNFYFYDKAKVQIQTADMFIKNSATKKWTGFASPKDQTSLKCPISGMVYPSVVYPQLIGKVSDTVFSISSKIRASISDSKYDKYYWSNGDQTATSSYLNSGNYWYAHYWFTPINGVNKYCYQLDSFHFSRLDLRIPIRKTAKLGSSFVVAVKDSLNTNSQVTWSNGKSGWSTVYTVTKNTDTLYATQSDAYRSVTKFMVITGKAEAIKVSQEDQDKKNNLQDSLLANQKQTLGNGNTLSSDSLSQTQSGNIQIYPNPVSDVLFIEGIDCDNTNAKQLINCHYEIFNSTGQLVQEGNISRTISVVNLITGSYTLKIGNNSYKFLKK
jgi:hypothetical protein